MTTKTRTFHFRRGTLALVTSVGVVTLLAVRTASDMAASTDHALPHQPPSEHGTQGITTFLSLLDEDDDDSSPLRSSLDAVLDKLETRVGSVLPNSSRSGEQPSVASVPETAPNTGPGQSSKPPAAISRGS